MSRPTWFACWWCGLPLLDDEPALCAEHGDLIAPRPVDPTRIDLLKGITDAGLADLAAQFTPLHLGQLEHLADHWAAAHDLAVDERRAYVATAVREAGEWLRGVPQREAEHQLRERRLRAQLDLDDLRLQAQGAAA